MPNRHTIQKQLFEVTTSDRTAKVGFEREVRDLYLDILVPKMETLFDEYAGPETRIRAEKLEIQITLPYSKTWKERLCTEVVRELEQALRTAVRQDVPSSGREPELLSEAVVARKKTGEGFTRSDSGDEKDIFFYFLSAGVFPWYADKRTLPELKQYLQKLIAEGTVTLGSPFQPVSFLGRLVKMLHDQRVALSRMLTQFGEPVLIKLFSQTEAYRTVDYWVTRIPFLATQEHQQRRWATIVDFIHTRRPVKDATESTPVTEKEIMIALLSAVPPQTMARFWETAPEVRRQLEERYPLSLEERKNLQLLAAEPEAERPKPSPQKEKEIQRSTTKRLEEEGIYVDNAGLAILHPFLAPLFTGLKFWNGSTFVSDDLHQRAVLVSQYMVYPGEDFPEHQLLLNKILCGYDIEETLPAVLEVTEQEMLETNNLLESVIRYWTMNGRAVFTTVDNLRASFLQRPGKLSRKPSGDWMLQVEGKGYDIVMKGLPWGIGMILHPWMKNMLRVEWP